MVKTRSQAVESKGKEVDKEDQMESRLSKLEEIITEQKAMVKQLADMVEAFCRSKAGKIEFPKFEDECDDDQTFDDKEEIHPVHETLTNPAPIEEDVSSDQICDEKELVSIDLDLQEVQTKTVAEEKLNLPKGKNIEHLVGENFETFSTDYSSLLNLSSSNRYQKDSTWIESSLYLLCSLKDGRVWEPGGLPNKMDLRDWPETELKPCGESQQVATFLYSLMQVVKSNLAEFKTFDRKRSDRTLSLEDEQDDEPEQNQVIKLVSSRNNHIWEPGGLLSERDKWLEKCYNRGRLMRLMHWMSSMWSKETKSRESERLSACSCVDIKTWHCVKHETQQTDFHVWHRWKNKAERLPEDYAFLELMMLGLVSFQSNKGNGLVGLVPKAIRVMLVGRFSGGGIKEVSLGCLGIHNMKLKEEVGICFRTHHNLRCLITHSVLETTKLHEISSLMSLQKNAEMTSPLAKETQGWIVNTWCMIQRMIVSVWKSFGYLMEAHGSKYKGLGCVVEKKKLRNLEDGVKQDKNRLSGDVRAKILMAFEELHLLQDVFEMVKELLLKTSSVIQGLVSQEPAISANQEPANSATQEPAIFQPDNAHGMITRGKDGIVKPNPRYMLLAVQMIWDKDSHEVHITNANKQTEYTREGIRGLVNIYDWCIVSQLWLDHRNKTCYVPIEDLFKETDAYFLRQEEFEQLLKTNLIIQQVMRDKKIRLSKRWWFKYRFDEEDQGSLQSRAGQRRNHGLSIRLHSKQKQRKCPKSWMFKFKTGSKLAGTSHLKRHKESGLCAQIRGVRKKSKLFLLYLSPSFLCRAMLRFFSSLPNLEVKVSLKGEDVIQEKRTWAG